MTTMMRKGAVPVPDGVPPYADHAYPWQLSIADGDAGLAFEPQERPSIGQSFTMDVDGTLRGAGRYRVRFFQQASFATMSELILVDVEPIDVWPPVDMTEEDSGYQQVEDLRNAGRELLASEVLDMLRASQQDPGETTIQLFSLQAMARFLIKHGNFDDPIAGPDPHGIMQIEWHIDGNGLLVLAFLGGDQVRCVAQADACPSTDKLNISVQLSEDQAAREFGHLVPLR